MPPRHFVAPEDLIEWRLNALEEINGENRLTTLESRVKELQKTDEKLDSVHSWLMGIAGGVIVALILLAINLGLTHSGRVPLPSAP